MQTVILTGSDRDRIFCKVIGASVHISVCEVGRQTVPDACANCDQIKSGVTVTPLSRI